MDNNKKVAILKSRLYKGGVAQVLGYIIRILNQQGIVPDILTLRSDLNTQDFETLYKLKIDFRIVRIGPNLKMPYEWHFLYFNLLSKRYSKKYDLFINSNNTSYLASKKITTITYVHFPRKDRVISPYSSIHFPEKKDKSFFDIANDPFYVAKLLYKFDKKFGANETLVANSLFTSEKIIANYPDTKNKIQIIYPPVDTVVKNSNSKKIQVVSLGRISPEKRQLEQIEIALQLPHIPFYILGFSDLGDYYKKCKNKIETSNATNIHLLPNLNYSEIQKILSESLVFLHNVRNEPFGIGIVQAAENGCIPVVHQSGGAIEIVHDQKLQFHNNSDAVSIIDKITKGELSFTFSNRFTSVIFEQEFEKLLSSIQSRLAQ